MGGSHMKLNPGTAVPRIFGLVRRVLLRGIAWVTVGSAIAICAASLATATAGSASASAYSCTPYTSARIHVGDVTVSPTNWCGGPNGSGLTVKSVTATFASSLGGVGWMCNTSMRVRVFNNLGGVVWTGYTGTRGGCHQAGGAFVLTINRTFATDGHIETSLLSYGATLATLSDNLKK
jgi:hypothetical protein